MKNYFKMIEPYRVYGGYIDSEGYIRVDYPNRVPYTKVYTYRNCRTVKNYTRHMRLYT